MLLVILLSLGERGEERGRKGGEKKKSKFKIFLHLICHFLSFAFAIAVNMRKKLELIFVDF